MTVLAPTHEEVLHWLALHLLPGLGKQKAVQLISTFGSPEAVFRASPSEIEAQGVAGAVARSLASGCSFEEAAAQQQKALEMGVAILPITDPRYPARLRDIFDPPLLLYGQGRVELLADLPFGVVGTRRPTPYGQAVAAKFAADLAAAGLVIVSGMARGIDTAAHRATLDGGGNTIAVFGCGVDHIYPAENRKLAEEIAQKGLLLSEFPLGTAAHPQNFPVRNRIISGVSIGVLIVEGAEYSGSAITARLAMEQQREVFAVPGNVTSKMSWGPNLLIKQGAKLVQGWNDVVSELDPEYRQALVGKGRQRLLPEMADNSASGQKDSQPVEMKPLLREILKIVPVDRVVALDELIETLERYSSSELIAALFELEMLGLIRQYPGKSFMKVW